LPFTWVFSRAGIANKTSPPLMIISSSVSVAPLLDRWQQLLWWFFKFGFHLHISYTTMFTGIDLYYATNTAISSHCVGTFLFWASHFFLGTNEGKVSLVHRLQNESTIFYTNSTRCLGLFVSLNGPCDIRLEALPNNMSLGHK
jgi:hypothetical protein